MIIRKITSALVAIIVVIGAFSCVEDISGGRVIVGEGEPTLVKLEIQVPGNTLPSTRALQEEDENEVSEVVIFAFEKGSEGNWDTPLKHVGKSIGNPEVSGTTKQFTVELLSGEWDLWALGNADSIIEYFEDLHTYDDIYSDDFIEYGLTKSDFQEFLIKVLDEKWSLDPDDPEGNYRMPMWGMLDDIEILPTSTNIIRTMNMYRMLVKVDIEVQESRFELSWVSLHNYNTVGRLVPGITAQDGSWTDAGGGVALRTSLPEDPYSVYGWDSDHRLEWSEDGVIYTFEADSGTFSGNRPCIIIGGKYDGSDEVTYYRADFRDSDKNYLDLLRNHRYSFIVQRVDGEGFSTIEEAYTAGPTNIEAEVIEWNEGLYLEGVWSGSYEIRLTGRSVHFSQFGEPASQTISVRTNLPALTFEEFSNVTSAANDNVWYQTGESVWSNDHFEVTIGDPVVNNEYREYTITITALPTAVGDPARSSVFYIKGYMLKVSIEILQDHHIGYRLQTDPDPEYAIIIDGTAQRVKINVLSTHPYKIDFMEYDMFNGVYGVATGGSPMTEQEQANISNSTTELYIGIEEHDGEEARVGEFYIQHIDVQSDASAKVYSIIQMMPIIVAELEDGGLEAELPKEGGDVVIKVSSNLAEWVPVLYIDEVEYEGDLLDYFNVERGTKSRDVIFTAPALSPQATIGKSYKIKFRDANNETETITYILITQRVLNGTPPVGGTPALENILAVDANGELNLDGNGYTVFFRWGSTVAISASSLNFNSTQIAWAPEGFDISSVGDDWDKVPYASPVYLNSLPPNLPAQGLGDPCKLASKGGVTGGWKMPEPSVFGEVGNGSTSWEIRTINDVRVPGRVGQGVFYPAAGRRLGGTGVLDRENSEGFYWASSTVSDVYSACMDFTSTTVLAGFSAHRAMGYAIRCVPDN